jgi:hypothetical protein
MNHTLYKCVDCQKAHCQFCDGGLALCTVCKGAEATLTSTCTGAPLSEDQGRLVQAGKLDFKDGKWVRFGQFDEEGPGKRQLDPEALPVSVEDGRFKRIIATSHEESGMQKVLFIRAEWDGEAKVWVATSDDVPGLATEADTLEQLSTKLESMVPDLLDANGFPENQDVPYELLARRFSVAHRAAA